MTQFAPAFQDAMPEVDDPIVLDLVNLLDHHTQNTVWELCESLDEPIRQAAHEAVERFEAVDADVRDIIAAMKNHPTRIELTDEQRDALQALLAAAKTLRANG